MTTNVILPALGMAQENGTIVRWLKAEGEQVTKGEPIAEIETDKATVEIEAPASGMLAAIAAPAGETVPTGQIIAHIVTQDESAPANGGRQARLSPASPKARRLGLEYGMNLADVKGTGPRGAVLAADLRPAQPAAPAASTHAVPAMVSPGEEDGVAGAASEPVEAELDVSLTWRLMAERTLQSWSSAPHFYLVREVNASRLVAWREQVQRRGGQADVKITYTDVLVRLVAAALRSQPRINASWQDGKIIQHAEVHIGLAIAVDQGLVAPVIHHADRLNLFEIAARRQELVSLAQAAKLRPVDLQGGRFTISNLGMYGVDAFSAIINQPQVAILAVGRIADRVVPLHGQPSVQPMMVLTLSCDHRVIDGARGAQFLSALADLVEEPLGLLA